MSDKQMIDDGFGGCWEKCAAPNCGLHVVRPGKVQCDCDYDPTGKMAMLENTIATLTAERDNFIDLIERYQDAITEGDNVIDHREAMFLAARPQLKEQDNE